MKNSGFFTDLFFYEKLSVLLIESLQRETTRPEEQLTIVDNDLCVLA